MIRWFPYPQTDELLYSTVARCERYMGVSGSVFSRTVFSNLVYARANHYAYVKAVSQALGGLMTQSELVEKHTLLPLATPFVERRQQETEDEWYLKINSSSRYRGWFCFCPECWQESKQSRIWKREWQVPEVQVCLQHKRPLRQTRFRLSATRENGGVFHFVSPDEVNLDDCIEIKPEPHAELLAQSVRDLLKRPIQPVPTSRQWKRFYAELGRENCNEDDYLWVYLYEGAINFWGHDWLVKHRLSSIAWRNICEYRSAKWLVHLMMVKSMAPEMSLSEAIDGALKVDKLD